MDQDTHRETPPSLRERVGTLLRPDHSARILTNLALNIRQEVKGLPDNVNYVNRSYGKTSNGGTYVERKAEEYDDFVAGKVGAGHQMPYSENDRAQVIQEAAQVARIHNLDVGSQSETYGGHTVTTAHPDRIPMENFAIYLVKFAKDPRGTFILAENLRPDGSGNHTIRSSDGGSNSSLVNLRAGKDGLSRTITRTLTEIGIDPAKLLEPSAPKTHNTKFGSIEVVVTHHPDQQGRTLTNISLRHKK